MKCAQDPIHYSRLELSELGEQHLILRTVAWGVNHERRPGPLFVGVIKTVGRGPPDNRPISALKEYESVVRLWSQAKHASCDENDYLLKR
jgi:hypothetical protein